MFKYLVAVFLNLYIFNFAVLFAWNPQFSHATKQNKVERLNSSKESTKNLSDENISSVLIFCKEILLYNIMLKVSH